jgi:(p)ppGpp synthase/HD superfamily hydrolase
MNIQQTINFIKEAHKGQFDRAGNPFWNHPHRVMKYLGKTTYEKKIAALLHDILEDTNFTKRQLIFIGFPQESVDIVEILTYKPLEESYIEYIFRILKSKNFKAIHIKIADLFDFLTCRGL